MEYGINIGFFESRIGLKRAAELVSAAGFTQLDYTPRVEEDCWDKELEEAARIFAAYGLTVHQTHAPFNRYGKYGSRHKLCLDRCAEATERLGAKFMVAHGDEFDFDTLTFSPEAALDYNHSYFLPYVKQAEKSGYRVAFETVFEDWDRRRFSARAEELMGLILSFQSDSAVCCWDFGHAHVSFKKEAPAHILELGKLIQCTHLHDNTGRDSHQLPMTGTIRWGQTMDAFRQIGYAGVMSVEYSHGSMPPDLIPSFLDLTYKTAKHVWEYATDGR